MWVNGMGGSLSRESMKSISPKARDIFNFDALQ